MTDELSTDPVDDAALFNSVVTGKASEPGPVAPAANPAPSQPAAGAEPVSTQARDESGRFATPATAPIAPLDGTQQPEPHKAAEPAVPPSRLREEADARRAAERERDDLRAELARMRAQPQPQAQPQAQEQDKPKDFWDNPDEFAMEKARAAVAPVETMVRQFIFSNSEQAALREHGNEKVVAAQDALKAAVQRGEINPQEVQARLTASMDPVGDVVRWHQRQSALQTVGSDPNAWLQAEIEKRMADPTFQAEVLKRAQATANGSPAVVQPVNQNAAPAIPPSVSSIGTAAGNSSGPQSLDDAALFASTTQRRR